jgi:GTP cyclohydrolase IA
VGDAYPTDMDNPYTPARQRDVVRDLLYSIGEDPYREGLAETPDRVVRSWGELFAGYGQDPKDVFKAFGDGAERYDEMITLTDIPLVSTCEHHLLPIVGVAHVAYVPHGRIIGLSKLARLVDVFARRLQVQERLTQQVAQSLMENLEPAGAAYVIRATHFCMVARGVQKAGAEFVTSSMLGVFRDKPEARAEFLSLVRK